MHLDIILQEQNIHHYMKLFTVLPTMYMWYQHWFTVQWETFERENFPKLEGKENFRGKLSRIAWRHQLCGPRHQNFAEKNFSLMPPKQRNSSLESFPLYGTMSKHLSYHSTNTDHSDEIGGPDRQAHRWGHQQTSSNPVQISWMQLICPI